VPILLHLALELAIGIGIQGDVRGVAEPDIGQVVLVHSQTTQVAERSEIVNGYGVLYACTRDPVVLAGR